MRWRPTLVLTVVTAGLASCGDPRPVTIPTGLATGWDLLSHRISVLEVSVDPEAGLVRAESHGGTFGAVDDPWVRVEVQEVSHAGLTAVAGSTDLVAAAAPDLYAPEAGTATTTARVPRARLGGATRAVALLRGFRIDTDRYDAPPPFASDPTLPYDPADGFTTGGVALALGAPAVDGSDWAFTVAATNRLLPDDRPDMNAAMPQAQSWIRVDWLLVGAGDDVDVALGDASYALSFPAYGSATPQPHADAAAQRVTFPTLPGAGAIGVGLVAFDLAVNLDGRHDPACLVAQDAINSWGEPVAGPGRYLRELGVAVQDLAVDRESGAAAARLDLYVSTASDFKEEGNLCAGVSGTAALLRSARATGAPPAPRPVEQSFVAGEPATVPLP